MKIATLIAQHLLEVHEGNNWTEVDIASTLKDVTAQEAITLTAASANTIASLLNHLTFWNRVMVQRIKGIAVDIPANNGFESPSSLTEEEWLYLKEDNLASAQELAKAIASVDEARLGQDILPGYSSFYKNLQGSVEHVHYHLGQIVMIKKLLRSDT